MYISETIYFSVPTLPVFGQDLHVPHAHAQSRALALAHAHALALARPEVRRTRITWHPGKPPRCSRTAVREGLGSTQCGNLQHLDKPGFKKHSFKNTAAFITPVCEVKRAKISLNLR